LSTRAVAYATRRNNAASATGRIPTMARVTQQQEQTTAARTDQPRAASRSLALQPPPYGIEFADHHAPQARGASSLRVGPAGDASEREAERIATAVTGASRERATADIQRAPDSDAMTAAGGPLTGDLAGRIASARGGSPLPGPLRATMEASIGADFRGVRVHTDAESAQLSRSLGARAFTHGRDIFLGAGRHDPASTSGQRLLAHELTHVVQQGAAPRLGGRRPRRPRAGPDGGALRAARRRLRVREQGLLYAAR
jgi:hypothetical protein